MYSVEMDGNTQVSSAVMEPSCLFRNIWWEKTHSTPGLSPSPLPPTSLIPERRSWTIPGSTPTSWSHGWKVRPSMLEKSFSSILVTWTCCRRGQQRQMSDDRAVMLRELPVCTITAGTAKFVTLVMAALTWAYPKSLLGKHQNWSSIPKADEEFLRWVYIPPRCPSSPVKPACQIFGLRKGTSPK